MPSMRHLQGSRQEALHHLLLPTKTVAQVHVYTYIIVGELNVYVICLMCYDEIDSRKGITSEDIFN